MNELGGEAPARALVFPYSPTSPARFTGMAAFTQLQSVTSFTFTFGASRRGLPYATRLALNN